MDLRPFMERWHMLPPSGGVMLVAVSGGRDSVCLLHYLAAMPRDFTVAAAHLNHGQRPTAGRDVDFVRQLCRELDGKVWALTLAEPDVPASLVHHTISNLAREENGIRLRILSETQPHPDARPVEADLEEVFLYHCGEETQ